MTTMDFRNEEFKDALLNINRKRVSEIFQQGYNEAKSFNNLEKMIILSLEQIGDGWEKGVYSLAQVYMSGVICEELIDEYMPKTNTTRKTMPIIAIGVLQDHHALGKRIVYSVLRASGYELIDLGQGLKVHELVKRALENHVEVLLISTLMLSSALKIRAVRDRIDEDGKSMKIIAGGAPFRMDGQLWKKIGADADGKNASDVVNIIEKVMSSR